jgi:AcrR family transcriptional regulator
MGKKTRADWIAAGWKRLRGSGVDGVRIEPLALDLRVTKGSFYWHFADRQALLDAMLEEWRHAATENVIVLAEEAGADPATRLSRLIAIATRGFDTELEFGLRAWGRADASVKTVLDNVDGRRLGYLRELLRGSGFAPAEAEARAFLFYAMLLGDALLPESHGRFSRRRVLREAFSVLTRER